MVRYPLEYNQILNRTKYNTFGPVRKNKDGSVRFHKGWDFVAPMWTPIFPVATGKIVGVTRFDKEGSKYGITVTLKFKEQGSTYWAFYAHLASVAVNVGDEITSTGTILGYVGDSGNSKGIKASCVHLHFEFRNRELGGNGTTDRIDPVQFYGDPPYDGLYYIDDE